MPTDDSFPVEDFITAITSQLDRVQDALRVKAVNRPLTYALKDLALELKVFVQMDKQGKVRFRTSGPNEAGASTVNLGFTTITKPMIEENTISMAATRSPSLEDIGLGPEERRKLERVGVSNLAQLNRLGSSAGLQTVARMSELPLDRIKYALSQGQPRLDHIQADRPHTSTGSNGFPPKPAPSDTNPPQRLGPSVSFLPPRRDLRNPSWPPVIRLPEGTRRLNLNGANLVGEDGPPSVRLNDRQLEIARADNDEVIVHLPPQPEAGTLEIALPDGRVETFEVALESDHDTWAPREGGL